MSNFFCPSDAYEIRTRILTLRGLYPKPLDEGAMNLILNHRTCTADHPTDLHGFERSTI